MIRVFLYINDLEFIESKEDTRWMAAKLREPVAGIAVIDVLPLHNLHGNLLPDLILELLTPFLQRSTHSPIAG